MPYLAGLFFLFLRLTRRYKSQNVSFCHFVSIALHSPFPLCRGYRDKIKGQTWSFSPFCLDSPAFAASIVHLMPLSHKLSHQFPWGLGFFFGLHITLIAWHPARMLEQHGKQHTLNQVCMLGAADSQLAGAGAR